MTNPLLELNRLKQITGTAIRFEESTTGYLWTIRITFGSHTATCTWLNKREARQQAAQDIIDELTRSGELQEIEETHEQIRRQREILRENPEENNNVNQVVMYTHERQNASHYMMFHASDPSLSHIFQTDLNPQIAVGNFAVGIDTEGIRNGYLPALVQITSREITYLIRFTGEAYCERGAQYPIQLQDLFQNPNIVKYVFGNENLGPGATNVIDVQRLAMESELILSYLSRFFGRPVGQPPSLVEVASIVKYLYELQTDREPRKMTRYIKNRELTCSNWFAGELTMEQRRYAASDAQLTRICGMFIPLLEAN